LKSLEAVNFFADNSFDFVFIDGDHTYEGVKADIAAWSPKLKPTGMLAGHDYTPAGHPDTSFEGVGRAVREAFGDNIRVIHNTWIRK
jgi:predicted O-methyltransferase YrrM